MRPLKPPCTPGKQVPQLLGNCPQAVPHDPSQGPSQVPQSSATMELEQVVIPHGPQGVHQRHPVLQKLKHKTNRPLQLASVGMAVCKKRRFIRAPPSRSTDRRCPVVAAARGRNCYRRAILWNREILCNRQVLSGGSSGRSQAAFPLGQSLAILQGFARGGPAALRGVRREASGVRWPGRCQAVVAKLS
jgi:hypothetical protein